MKTAYLKLPPLPKRNLQFKIPSIQCQSISLQQKCTTVEDRCQRDEENEFIQPKGKQNILQRQRPTSKKQQGQIRSHSNQPCKERRSQSIDKKIGMFISEVPPRVTAKSWILYDMQQDKSLWGHRCHKRREMASLTKMMNPLLFSNWPTHQIKATKSSTAITGTTAQLRLGAEYNLYDLFFGMMLPSGNDAAYLIAECGGFLLKYMKDNISLSLRQINGRINEELQTYSDQFVTAYLKEMNRVARKIEMASSNFDNPHGLSNPNNYSTAQDLAKLCTYSMRNSTFRKIVQTRRYSYSITTLVDKLETISSAESLQEEKDISPGQYKQEVRLTLNWDNTNRMLGQGWSGIKTGITPNAGPCLAASQARILQGRRYEFLVILLDSESMEARWTEVKQLVSWAIQNRRYI